MNKKFLIYLILLVNIFSFFSCKRNSNLQTVILDEDFKNNEKNWIDTLQNHPLLIQKIFDNTLYLESNSPDMGAISTIELNINESANFTIETSLKIDSELDFSYATLDFGMKKENKGLREVDGQLIPTTLGDKYYYFGYSNSKEILISEWNKGNENYLFRGLNKSINIEDFNHLKISKINDSVYYYLNNQFIFNHEFKKMPGKGLGFSTSPIGKAWIKYIKVVN